MIDDIEPEVSEASPEAAPDAQESTIDVTALAAAFVRVADIGHLRVPRIDLTSVLPQLDLPRLLPPAPADWITSQLAAALRPLADAMRAQAKLLEPAFENLRSVVRGVLEHALPANLRAVEITVDHLETLAKEGITVYAVPSSDVVRQLLAAPNAQARRDVLGRRFVRIVADCDEVLDVCVAPDTREAVVFARAGIAAAREGHPQAAQALWANTLDSLLHAAFEPSLRKTFVDSTHRTSTDPRTFRELLLMAPIAHGYGRYFPARGDLIPRTFSRHASAHGVSRKQYSKRNAAQALLLLTSLIAYLNDL